MDNIELPADLRAERGKKVRFLRRQGLIPANLYGPKIDSVSLQIRASDLQQALIQGGRNAVFGLRVNGEKASRTAVIRAVQLHPVTDVPLHVDLLQVDITQSITADVPVVLVGESPLPKGQTLIVQSIPSVQVSGLPMDVPRSMEVDISVLVEIDQSIWVRDLQFPASIEVLTDPDQLVVRASLGRVVEEIEEAEAIEGEEEVEGEAEVEAEGAAPEAREGSEAPAAE